MYAHLATRAMVSTGQVVIPGQQIGIVGETGDATACHLHFELWKGRWFAGGGRTDPLPNLRAWDKFSGGPLQTEPQPPPISRAPRPARGSSTTGRSKAPSHRVCMGSDCPA
jgi:murein DD-endopeptidase MepM/ murein hydrolase activator NlpD